MIPDTPTMPDHRFAELSLNLSRLERESRKYLYIGLVLGIAFYVLACLITFKSSIPVPSRQTEIPISGDIIVLPPSVSNPYETWQRIPEPRSYIRQQSSARALPEASTSQTARFETPSDRYRTGIQTDTVMEGEVYGAYNDTLAAIEYELRKPQYDIPLSNPLFIDTGDYKAEIIFNPKDKMAIQGYVHFGIAWGRSIHPPDSLRQSVHHLAETLRTHTNIVATADRQVMLSPISSERSIDVLHSARSAAERANYLADYTSRGSDLNEYPFLFMAVDGRMILSESERIRLRDYLLGQSGFILIDNGSAGYDDGHIDEQLKKSITSMLYTEEVRIYLFLMPLSLYHPVYHAFFDFPDGEPQSTVNPSAEFTNTIYGIYYDGGGNGSMILVGIYTPQGYSRSWQDPKNTEQLKMGVNMVVFALTRYKEALRADGTQELLSDRRILRR